MLDLLKYCAVYIILGFLPVFLFLLKKDVNIYLNLIISIAFAPVLIALLNIISVLLGLQATIWQYSLPLLLLSGIIFIKPDWEKLTSIKNLHTVARPVIIGVFFGLIYWYLFFYHYYRDGKVYADVIWNLGIIGELKNHFPPLYVQWKTEGTFLYHYLANLGFAGISNFSGLNVIQTVLKFGYLVNSISIFVILSLIIKDKIVESLILVLVIIFIPYTVNWEAYNYALGGHLSGFAASTYFWSLPVLFASVYLVYTLNETRFDKNNIFLRFTCSFILVFATGFSKVSNLLIILGIELWYFIRFFFKFRIYQIKQLIKHIKPLSSFLILPFFSFILFYIFSSKSSFGLVPGIEIRDFKIFESWNPFYPFIAIYSSLLIFIYFKRKEISQLRWEFLFCGFLNLIMYLLTRQVGGSDVYFAFNAIICNVLVIAFSSFREIIKPFIYSYALAGLLILFFSDLGYFKGFAPFEFSLKSLRDTENEYFNFKSDTVNDLLKFSAMLPKDALIASPRQPRGEAFIYSAFIGRRIWNEDPRYTPGVLTYWSLSAKFLTSQGFIPDFVRDTPRVEDYQAAYLKYTENLEPAEVENFEKEDERFLTYQKIVFEELPPDEYEKIVREFGLTHIIVKEEEKQKINSWLRSKENISGKYITIFVVSTL